MKLDREASEPGGASRPGSNPSRGHKWWTLLAMAFTIFMALLDMTIVYVALPTIQKDMHANFSDLQWVVNAYALTLAVFLVTSGRLGDIFGRKRVFMLGLTVFTAGSLLCGLSGGIAFGGFSHMKALLAARAIQGVGASIMFPMTLAIITATFDGPERGRAIGIWGSVSGLATAIGPLAGGFLVENVGWQSIFFVNVPIGIVAVLVASWAVVESRDDRAPHAIDVFGLVTATACLFCLTLALIQGNDSDKGWTSPYIVTLFTVAAVALALFVLIEPRIADPMVDLRLFRNLSFTGAAITVFALSAGMISAFFFLTIYFQDFLGFSAIECGVRFLPLSGLILLSAPLGGIVIDRLGARPVLTVGMLLLTISLALMTRISPHDLKNDWVILLPAFIAGGLGMGFAQPPISTVAVGTVERARAGMASGVNGMCRQIGSAFGVAFLGAMLTGRYNGLVSSRVGALSRLPAGARQSVIVQVQGKGTIAGSLGLPVDPANPTPLVHSPVFPLVQHIARQSFVDGTVFVFWLATGIVAAGTIAALFMTRRKDMVHEQEAAAAAAA